MPPTTFSGARTRHLTGTVEGELPFIGRRALLRLALLRLEAGRGTVLTGRTGIGKTRTLQAVAEAATAGGRRVGRVVASRSIAATPFGAFLGLLPAEVVRQAGRRPALDRALLVRAALLDLGLEVVAVDDAHLLDGESAALLLDLAAGGTAVVLVLDPAVQAADALLSVPDAARAETVELPPLSAAESAQLIEAVLQAPVDGGTALTLHEAAQGVPLVLRELLEALIRDEALTSADGIWSVREPVRPPAAVEARILERLHELDDATRAWVDLVAVAERVPADLASALVDEDAADRAEATGWVRFDTVQQAYRLDQPLDREPILSGTGPRMRRRLLATLVAGLTALERPLRPAEAVDLGRWRLEVGERLERDEALGLAGAVAATDARLAERFLRATADDGDPIALIALAQHLVAAGEIPEAERLLQRAAALGGQPVRVAALSALATGLGRRRSGEALEALEQVIADHPDEPDLMAAQIALLAAEDRTAEATEVARRLGSGCERGPGAVLGGVYGAVAMAVRGQQAEGEDAAGRLRPLAERNVRELPEGPMLQAWLEAAVPWTSSRDPASATAIAQRGYDQTLRAGLRPDRARFAHLLAAGRLLQGDATLAVRLLREAESAQCFWRDSSRPEIVANLVSALVFAGEQQEAESALARLDAMTCTPQQESVRRLARAVVLAGAGDRQAAAVAAATVGRDAEARGDRATAADAWTDALRYGGEDAARALLAQGDVPAGPVRDLVRAHAAAVLAHDPVALLAVADGYWRREVRILALEAVSRAARWLLELPDTAAAAAATETLLRWSIATPGLTDPLAEALPLAGLTSREQEIVRLAASGLPDKGIAVELGISLRTAQTHLGRAFNKLGVHRRQELHRLMPADVRGEPIGAEPIGVPLD